MACYAKITLAPVWRRTWRLGVILGSKRQVSGSNGIEVGRSGNARHNLEEFPSNLAKCAVGLDSVGDKRHNQGLHIWEFKLTYKNMLFFPIWKAELANFLLHMAFDQPNLPLMTISWGPLDHTPVLLKVPQRN